MEHYEKVVLEINGKVAWNAFVHYFRSWYWVLEIFPKRVFVLVLKSETFDPQTNWQVKMNILNIEDILRVCVIVFKGNRGDHFLLSLLIEVAIIRVLIRLYFRHCMVGGANLIYVRLRWVKLP